MARRVKTDCSEGIGAKQAPAQECDINAIMKRYQRTGQLPVAVRVASYGDFSGPSELLDARAVVARAEAQFDALPSAVRARFKNDPAAFLAFVADKANHAEAKKLGLLEEEPPPNLELAELKRIADAVARDLTKDASK